MKKNETNPLVDFFQAILHSDVVISNGVVLKSRHTSNEVKPTEAFEALDFNKSDYAVIRLDVLQEIAKKASYKQKYETLLNRLQDTVKLESL